MKSDELKTRFKTVIENLDFLKLDQVDEFIECLQVGGDPDCVVEVFELLKSECGFKHSWVSRFVIAHVLAGQRRIKLLRSGFMQMLQEEGIVLLWCLF